MKRSTRLTTTEIIHFHKHETTSMLDKSSSKPVIQTRKDVASLTFFCNVFQNVNMDPLGATEPKAIFYAGHISIKYESVLPGIVTSDSFNKQRP